MLLPSASLESTKTHTARTSNSVSTASHQLKKNEGSAQRDGRGNLSGQVLSLQRRHAPTKLELDARHSPTRLVWPRRGELNTSRFVPISFFLK